jgi:hypothetical protein
VVPEAVAVIDRSREDVRDGLDAPMWVPRKPGDIVFGIFVPKVVEQEKWIEVTRISKSKRATQSHTRAFDCGLSLNDPFNWS